MVQSISTTDNLNICLLLFDVSYTYIDSTIYLTGNSRREKEKERDREYARTLYLLIILLFLLLRLITFHETPVTEKREIRLLMHASHEGEMTSSRNIRRLTETIRLPGSKLLGEMISVLHLSFSFAFLFIQRVETVIIFNSV